VVVAGFSIPMAVKAKYNKSFISPASRKAQSGTLGMVDFAKNPGAK
jgi:hypothetical protein